MVGGHSAGTKGALKRMPVALATGPGHRLQGGQSRRLTCCGEFTGNEVMQRRGA